MLQIEEVSKSYGQHLILEIKKLTITDGIYWIQGKNGSGKTTLMKILGGIIPFEGSVALHNIDLIKNPVDYRKQISYAEAEPLYPPFLTGTELLKFVQATRKDNDQNVESLIDTWGIRSFMSNRVETYSSGMVKKLSLALAFIGNTKLILLDEPLITLEDSSIPVLFNLIHERSKAGTSFLFTSHQAFVDTGFSLTGKIIVEHQTARME